MNGSIFDLIQAQNVVAYYQNYPQLEPPFLGDELFPSTQQMGMNLEFLKGANNQPVALRPAAFDTKVIPRPREGFTSFHDKLPYFKESTYIDEDLRQQLIMVQNSNNPAYQDMVINHIFQNATQLISAAGISREILRMEALTTGKATVEGNGVFKQYDYFMPDSNKVTAKKAWDQADSNPLADIRDAKQAISYSTGATITRAVMNQATWNALLANETIKATLLSSSANASAAVVLDSQLTAFLQSNTSITFAVYDKGYKDAENKLHQYIPDGMVVFLPAGNLGNTVFGTTPEEADLRGLSVANVALTDTGVAVTTMAQPDPVSVETKVSQLVAPSFPMVDSVYVLSGLITPPKA